VPVFPAPKIPKIGKNTEILPILGYFWRKKAFNFGKIANSS
jgi:hypothetical protein